ncbi:MAG: hypothetical protein SWX82_33680 [Cyanobacteriota bacterium]|nr:hypothetical protein [Cyanobacteriota bacterium]
MPTLYKAIGEKVKIADRFVLCWIKIFSSSKNLPTIFLYFLLRQISSFIFISQMQILF